METKEEGGAPKPEVPPEAPPAEAVKPEPAATAGVGADKAASAAPAEVSAMAASTDAPVTPASPAATPAAASEPADAAAQPPSTPPPAGPASETTVASPTADPAPEPIPPVIDPPRDNKGMIAGIIALVILLVGVLGAVFIAQRGEKASAPPPAERRHGKGDKGKDAKPFTIGEKVAVSVTVLPEDAENLDCGSKEEIAGKHCAFEAAGVPWSKGDAKDDKLLLRPYATTTRRRLLGAGMWSQLPTPLPEKRFTVKCTFNVEGKIDKPAVRFRKSVEIKEMRDTWYGGALTDCTVVPPK